MQVTNSNSFKMSRPATTHKNIQNNEYSNSLLKENVSRVDIIDPSMTGRKRIPIIVSGNQIQKRDSYIAG